MTAEKGGVVIRLVLTTAMLALPSIRLEAVATL